jgi:hypothetical protein
MAERLALPKTTVYYWIKGLPLGRVRRWSELAEIPTFRDFVALLRGGGV